MSAIARAEGAYSETEIDDEAVVMNLASGEFFSLTGTAREIWRLIDGNRDRDALLAELAGGFDAKPAEIAADLDNFLESLAGAGLIAGG
jgi:pyrroloquinoline quinone biosynthesis protein D